MSSATSSRTAMIKYVQIIYYRFRYLLHVMSLSNRSTASGTFAVKPVKEPYATHRDRRPIQAARLFFKPAHTSKK